MRINIPFDFIVRGKTLRAGAYEITTINDSETGLNMRSVTSHGDHIMFETEPLLEARAPRRSEIVFHRYGDTYFLSEILTAGRVTGAEVRESRAERQLKRELESNMASNQTEPERVALEVH